MIHTPQIPPPKCTYVSTPTRTRTYTIYTWRIYTIYTYIYNLFASTSSALRAQRENSDHQNDGRHYDDDNPHPANSATKMHICIHTHTYTYMYIYNTYMMNIYYIYMIYIYIYIYTIYMTYIYYIYMHIYIYIYYSLFATTSSALRAQREYNDHQNDNRHYDDDDPHPAILPPHLRRQLSRLLLEFWRFCAHCVCLVFKVLELLVLLEHVLYVALHCHFHVVYLRLHSCVCMYGCVS